MMTDTNIDKFFLRNEELEAEQEKVGKRQLDMITDEFSMEVGSPELGFGMWIGRWAVLSWGLVWKLWRWAVLSWDLVWKF